MQFLSTLLKGVMAASIWTMYSDWIIISAIIVALGFFIIAPTIKSGKKLAPEWRFLSLIALGACIALPIINYQVKEALKELSEPVKTAFHAIEKGDIEKISSLLLLKKVTLTDKDKQGFTIAHLIVMRAERSELWMQFLEGILDKDASAAQIIGISGWSLLHLAAYLNSEDICVALLASGAKKNLKDEKGRLPYNLATKAELAKTLSPLLNQEKP